MTKPPGPESTVLYQGPGYTIARTTKAKTLVPYFRVERPDGKLNHGWVDLRDRPELAREIPEATQRPGLVRLLEVANQKGSGLMSTCCDGGCKAIDRGGERTIYASCFAVITFRNPIESSEPERFIDLARVWIHYIPAPPPDMACSFNFVIEPYGTFFGHSGCHALTIMPEGYGVDEAAAWRSFNHAADAAAAALQRIIDENNSPGAEAN